MANNVVKNPKLSETLEFLEKSFARTYDLTNPAEQMAFVEGMTELGKNIVFNSTKATLNVALSTDGLTNLVVSVSPKPYVAEDES